MFRTPQWREEAGEEKQDLKQRTKQFALRVIRPVESLPKNRAAEVIGKQLLRSGTSVHSAMEGAMADKPLILAVDHNRRNLELLSQFLGQEGYETIIAASLEEFDQALSEPQGVKLTLVDIAGFDRSVWERCERLRAADIPFIIISPRQSAAIQQASLTYGARGVLVKPLAVKELLGLVRSLI